MKRLFILVCYVMFTSCQDKVICPAFQSTYILDDSTRNAFFSYVWQLDEGTRSQFLAQQKGKNASDTAGLVTQPTTDYYAYAGEKVVPWRIQKRTKYGIIKRTPYPIKKYRLRTAPMENVLAPDPVSNTLTATEIGDTLQVDSAGVSADSLASTPAIAGAKKKTYKFLYGYDPADNFNVEQEYYNKYFGKRLVDNRPKPKPTPSDSLGGNVPDSLTTKEPFFKRLFKKKNKKKDTEEDDTETNGFAPVGEEATEEEEEEEEGNG